MVMVLDYGYGFQPGWLARLIESSQIPAMATTTSGFKKVILY
jgi:hypothetical protein